MSLQTFSPTSPASIMKEISSGIMLDVIKNFNTDELIDYLGRKDLKHDENDIKIIRKEKISGLAFLDTTKEKFGSYGLKADPIIILTKFIKSLNQKL